MIRQFKAKDKIINYRLTRSSRARHLRLSVSEESGLTVTLPKLMDEALAEKFIIKKMRWVLARLAQIAKLSPRVLPRLSNADFQKYRLQARELTHQRLEYFNKFYNFFYRRVSIKKQTTRWGSCSKKGNLNFNYRIVFLPVELLDYLIVHELCHLKEMNHSKNFWHLVSLAIPDYQGRRKRLFKLR